MTELERGIGRWEWSRPTDDGPVVMLLPDGVNVQVCEPFSYVGPDGWRWTVVAGCVSDGASIPRALWSSVGAPLTGKYRNAAILHDYLYRHCPDDPATGKRVTKQRADLVLLDAMRCSGAGEDEVIYWGVRLGGEGSWEEDQRARGEEDGKQAGP